MVKSQREHDMTRRIAGALAAFAAASKRQAGASQSTGALADAWERFTAFQKIFWNALIVLLVVLFVATVGKATFKRSTIIEPLSVPEDLAKQGYTGQVVAQQLIDQVNKVVREAQSTRPASALSSLPPEQQIPNVEVPGAGISLAAVIYFLRGSFGIYDLKISGEIVQESKMRDSSSPPKYLLHLRVTESGFQYRSQASNDDLSDLLKVAALPVLEQISPYLAGVAYLRRKDFVKATAMAQRCLSSDSPEERQWGTNLRGGVLAWKKRYEQAKKVFSDGDKMFPGFTPLRQNSGRASYDAERYIEALEISLDSVRVDTDPRRQSNGYSNAGLALDAMRRKGVRLQMTVSLSATLDSLFGDTILLLARDDGTIDARVERTAMVPGSEVLGLKDGEVPHRQAALAMFRRAMQVDSLRPDPYYRLGVIEYEAGDKQDAELHLEIAVALLGESDPLSSSNFRSESHRYLGRIRADYDDFDGAFAEFIKAGEIAEKSAWLWVNWAQALAKRAAKETAAEKAEAYRNEAVTKLERVINLTTDDGDLLQEAAEVFERLKLDDRALKIREKARALKQTAAASTIGNTDASPAAAPSTDRPR